MVQTIDTFIDIYTAAMDMAKQPVSNTTLLNRFKRYINLRYSDLALQRKWSWLLAKDVLNVIGKYTTGTVTATKDSTTVTGTSTVFTGKAGYKFKVDGFNEVYTIASVASATSMTLDDAYEGDTATAVSYTIWQDTYELANTIEEVDMVWHDHMSYPPVAVGPKKLNEIKVNFPTVTGKCKAWSQVQWSSDGDRQVAIYPIPDEDYSLHYLYLKRITALDATTDEPLMPVLYRHVLIYGALADFHLSEGDVELAQLFEGKYTDLVKRMAQDSEATEDFPQIVINETWRKYSKPMVKIDFGDLWDKLEID